RRARLSDQRCCCSEAIASSLEQLPGYKKKRARVSRPASLLQVVWSKPPVGGKPVLEGVDHRAKHGVLTPPEVLLAGCRVDEVIIREDMVVRLVVAIFRTDQQPGDIR